MKMYSNINSQKIVTMLNKNLKIATYTLLITVFFVLVSCKKENTANSLKETFVLSNKMLSTTKIATAVQEPLKNQLNFYGKITTDNNKFVEIYPVVGGNVIKVNVELGDYVKKGQLLAVIRSTEVAGFEKELDDAKNDLITAKNKYKEIYVHSKLLLDNLDEVSILQLNQAKVGILLSIYYRNKI